MNEVRVVATGHDAQGRASSAKIRPREKQRHSATRLTDREEERA
jgi:hypothetical protein